MNQPIPSVHLTLTIPERNVLLNFIDAAVKALGLAAAHDAYHLAKRLEDAPPSEFTPPPIHGPDDITDPPTKNP